MPNQVIIWTNDDGQLCETFNGDSKSLAEVCATIPNPSFITTTDQLPQDFLFRAAWVEDGSTVTEDLAKSKVVSLYILKDAAQSAQAKSISDTAVGDSPDFTVDAITASYQEYKVHVDSSTSTDNLRAHLKTFVSTYAPEVAAKYGLDISS